MNEKSVLLIPFLKSVAGFVSSTVIIIKKKILFAELEGRRIYLYVVSILFEEKKREFGGITIV